MASSTAADFPINLDRQRRSRWRIISGCTWAAAALQGRSKRREADPSSTKGAERRCKSATSLTAASNRAGDTSPGSDTTVGSRGGWSSPGLSSTKSSSRSPSRTSSPCSTPTNYQDGRSLPRLLTLQPASPHSNRSNHDDEGRERALSADQWLIIPQFCDVKTDKKYNINYFDKSRKHEGAPSEMLMRRNSSQSTSESGPSLGSIATGLSRSLSVTVPCRQHSGSRGLDQPWPPML